MVLLLLLGSRSFTALGLISVDDIMKNINNRNTKSDMDAELNEGSNLLRERIAITAILIV
jgi:hypothetical protein